MPTCMAAAFPGGRKLAHMPQRSLLPAGAVLTADCMPLEKDGTLEPQLNAGNVDRVLVRTCRPAAADFLFDRYKCP